MLNEIRLRPTNFVLIFAQPYVLNTYVQDCLTFSHYAIFAQRIMATQCHNLANSQTRKCTTMNQDEGGAAATVASGNDEAKTS